MQGNVRNVMLVPPENRAYRDYCRWHKEVNRPLGLRTGFGPAQRLPYVLEAAARAWLAERVALMPQRIVSYEQLHRGRWGRRYREIDAVAGRLGRPCDIFEVKVGREKLAQARKQMTASLSLLAAAGHRDLVPVTVLVPFGADDLATVPPDVRLVEGDVERAAACWSEGTWPVLVLPARGLWEQALAAGQVDDPTLWDAARAESTAPLTLAS